MDALERRPMDALEGNNVTTGALKAIMAMVEYHQATLELVQAAAEADGDISKDALTLQRANVNSLKGKVEQLVEALAQQSSECTSCSGKESEAQHQDLKKQVGQLYEGMLASFAALPAIEGARAAQDFQLQQALQAQAALLQACIRATQIADKAARKAQLIKDAAQDFAARSRTTCESLQEERQKLTQALHQSNGTQVAQLCQLKAADAAKNVLAANNEELCESLDRADSGLKAEKAEREAAQESARARQVQVTSLEQQLATSQADMEVEHGLKATLQANVQALQGQMEKYQQLAIVVEASKEKVEEQCTKKSAALDIKASEVKTLKQSIRKAEAELTRETASRVKADQTTADTQKEVSLLTKRLAEAHEQLDAKQLKLEHAERQVSLDEGKRKDEVAALTATLADREHNLSALEAKFNRMSEEYERMESHLKKAANTQRSSEGLGAAATTAVNGPAAHAPVVFEAAHESDKDGSQESGGQDQVEEEEEDDVEQEEATSSGRGQAGAAPQGPRGGAPAGPQTAPGNFHALPKIAGFAEQLYLDERRMLARGTSGNVFAGGSLHQLLQGQPQWAVKVVKPPVNETDCMNRLELDKELANLKLVAGQKRLVQYHGHSSAYRQEGGERVLKGYIVTDLLGPSLRKAVLDLDRNVAKVSPRRQRMLWVASLFMAVRELHSLRVVHHNIKESNFCLRSNARGEPNVVLIDMALLEDVKGHEHNFYSHTIGTPLYHAPEMLEFTAPGELRQGPRNAKQRVRDMQACDVWAAAATAFYVLTGQHLLQIPSDVTTLQEQVFEEQKLLLKALQNPEKSTHEAVETISTLGPDALDFFFKSLRSSPRERITATEALRHQFLANAVAQLERIQ